MKSILVLLAFLVATVLADKYAMVMGTADGWSNYSITSNPCIPAENIIYMSYTTDVTDKSNPFPGKIFTDPSEGEGKDYWPQCDGKIDYTGKAINKKVLLAVLKGDAATVTAETGIENPKVFKTTENDTIFLYFIDHGGDDVVVVGYDFLHASELLKTIKYMYDNKMYKELVFYMEACHSGSMWGGLPDDINMYVLSSADADHDAWMSNCPPEDVVNGKALNTCLAGLYDNAFMEAIEQSNGGNVTIKEIYEYTNKVVIEEGSDQNVSEFGAAEQFANYSINRFVGEKVISRANGSISPVKNIVQYSEVPRRIATWKAIRADKEHLADAMKELEELAVIEAKREVTIMRLARAATQDDVKADKLRTMKVNSYDRSCAATVIETLVSNCGFSTPLKVEHMNIIHNVCAMNIDIDFSNVCF
ncbi:hypothetical protein WA158_002951 [Blastocystis sp. Blastoise]